MGLIGFITYRFKLLFSVGTLQVSIGSNAVNHETSPRFRHGIERWRFRSLVCVIEAAIPYSAEFGTNMLI